MKKHNILLVEDEVLISMDEAQQLSSYGYNVIEAPSGEKAIELICQKPRAIDLVLMDIDLGHGIDGTEAARQILEHRDIPIVFLSSHTEPEVVEKTEKITSYGYVVKSSSITVLDASIKMAFKLFLAKQSYIEKEAALEKSQKEIEKHEKDLQKTQRIARLGSWHLDVATNEVSWTEELYKMFGYDPSLPPPPLNEQMKIFTIESWARLSASLENTVKTGEPYELELEMAREGKAIGWMWVRGEAFQDETGETVELWGAAQDITSRKQLEQALQRNEELLNRTGKIARVGGWEIDLDTRNVLWTKSTRELHELPNDYVPTFDEALSFFPGESGKILSEAFERAVLEGKDYDLELDFLTAKGKDLKVRTIGYPEHEKGKCKRVYGTLQDITLQTEFNRHKTLEQAQHKTLVQLHNMIDSRKENLFDFIIEASKRLTKSEYSFFGIMNEDETEMTIHSWSENVMESCGMTDMPMHFPITRSGIWGDCVRQRKTVIYNSYAKPIPTKHGIPKHHVPISRFMGIPIFDGDRIAAIGAVANKTSPYDNHDAQCLRTIYDRMWDIVMRNKAYENLHEIEWLFTQSLETGQNEQVYHPPYGDVTALNTCRTIMDSVDCDILESIAKDSVEFLGTSVAIYEKNGDYAAGIFASGWCQLLDLSSRNLCATNDNEQAIDSRKWLCHENCWNDSAKQTIITGKPTDIECVGGIHLYAEPIFANTEVIGSINIGYGTPPSDKQSLKALSEKFQVDICVLRNAALDYKTRPPYMIALAKQRLQSSALLIGKIVESSQYHQDLSKTIENYRMLQDDLYVKNWAIESSPRALAMADLHGKIVYVNKAFLTMWEVNNKNEVLGKSASEYWKDPEDAEAVILALQNKGTWTGKMTAQKSNGSTSCVHITANMVKNDENIPVLMFASFEEIPESIQTHENPRNDILDRSEVENRKNLEAVSRTSADINSLTLSDIIDIQDIQSLMEDFYAVTNIGSALVDTKGNVLVGVGWQDICTKFHRVNPETRKYCIESDLQLSSGIDQGEYKAYKCKNNLWDMASPLFIGGKHLGNIFFGQFFYDDEKIDTEFFRKKARKHGFDEDEYLSALEAVPRFSREIVNKAMSFYTRLARLISQLSYSNLQLAESLTEQKHAEDSLRESEERFKALHNASFGGITIHDKGCILDCNQGLSDITGYSFDELIGMDGLLLIAPDYRDFVMDKIISGYEEAYEAEGLRKDGSTFPLRLHGKNIPYKGKEVRVVEFRDITDIKKAQSAFRHALDVKQTLLRELGHRIKNSFTMIQSIINLSFSRIQDKDARNVLEDMKSRVSTMSDLYVLLHENDISPYVNIDEYCRSIVQSLTGAYTHSTKKISFNIECEPLQIDIKLASVIGMLINEILTNSLKYAFPDSKEGEITLCLKADNGFITLNIQDNGIGLPENTEPGKGSGFGMELISAMVSQINAKLTVTGDNGACYSIKIPFSPASAR
ncbi:MAG: PocR ligand-binding domain-containing protein [Spirochaetia bacterium]